MPIDPSPQLVNELSDYYGRGARRRNMLLERIDRVLGTKPKPKEDDPDIPELPPKPARFQPDPLIGGSPEFARGAAKLLNADPYVKSRVKSITIGPTADTMGKMIESKLAPGEFGDTNLRGLYGINSHLISVNPHMSDDQSLSTLSHELAHAAGYGHSEETSGAEEAAKIYRLHSRNPNPYFSLSPRRRTY